MYARGRRITTPPIKVAVVPEIAEVEFTRRHLNDWTHTRAVATFEVRDRSRMAGDERSLVGCRMLGWERRGKLLLGRFSGGMAMLSHLGMTGKWVLDPPTDRRHQRLVMTLSRGRTLALVDTRRFGWTMVGTEEACRSHPRWSNIGPDCLDEAWTGERLAGACLPSRQVLKDRLMNQRVIAGLGNIALVELAFRAGIHPHSPAQALTRTQWEAVTRGMEEHVREVLRVETGGEIGYVGEAKSTNPFAIYGRAGEPCPTCQAPIFRVVWKARPTFFCQACQPLAVSAG